ncbi:hypothetical protein BV898_17775 [Hypsibius exemplaris]|uniref:Uncharacterized protein n=1 Tax=Hypsibius exemplaris TaxID=2072580 RepID=A0A9X6NG52_HYPEX|nr:hypothetical protein BV898_17775 [Hypsibius exemplaris]
MDPYRAPPPVWEMPKQPPLYDPRTLLGNWYERQALVVDLAEFDAAERTKRALDLDHRIYIHDESNKPYAETGPYEDGSLCFGDTIHLSCVGVVPPTGHSHDVETPAVAVDFHPTSVEDSGLARAYGSIKDAEPKGRSIFTIKSGDINRTEYPPRTKRVCYNEDVYLVSAIDWQGMEWRLTSALEHLYDINLAHRKQTVWLYPLLTKKSLWSFQHVDHNLRPILEGQPVDARQPILLRHVLTGRNLTVNFHKRFKNAYGVEYLMTCDVDRDIHKMEKENSIFRIRQIEFPPRKMDRQKEKEFRNDLEQQIHQSAMLEGHRYAHLEAVDHPRYPHPHPHPSCKAFREEDATAARRIRHLR